MVQIWLPGWTWLGTKTNPVEHFAAPTSRALGGGSPPLGPGGAAEPPWPGLAGVRRALLTGGTGFLGCFLLAELLGALPEAQR